METTYQGRKVAYLEKGEGPLVVLLHGWGSNKELYGPLMNTLSVKYRVAAPDMPGFGGSREPDEAWALDDYCDFVQHFVTERIAGEPAARESGQESGQEPTAREAGQESGQESGQEPAARESDQQSGQKPEVILAGHSHGGRLLIKLLGGRELPFAVKKLILIDSAGIVHEKTPEQLKKIRRYKQGKKILGSPIVRRLFPHALEAFQSKSGSEDYRSASPIMRQSMVKVVNEDVREYLPHIKAETLLVWGDRDTATPLGDGQLMEKSIPGAGLAVLPGAGHFSFLDNQYQFLAVMRSFLGIDGV